MTSINYKAAGVDIEAGNEAVRRIKGLVEKTFSKAVLTGIGSFGAMVDLKPIMESYKHPVLVQSIDGVGTKMMVAKMMQKFDTIGIDLVSATSNDIVVLGAKPLTLLDYIASDSLNPDQIETIVRGMALACLEQGIALVGGETAEMPGTYLKGEYDLVGIVTGVLEKEEAILGHEICEHDVVLGLASSGLHTNGYSLARKLLFEVGAYTVDTNLEDLGQTVGEALLTPHINYCQPILHLLANQVAIKGMAHITGGGLLENIPRILPANCAVDLYKNRLPILPLFEILGSLGKLSEKDLFRTFNMGIGLVIVVEEAWVSRIQTLLADYPCPLYELGRVRAGQPSVSLVS